MTFADIRKKLQPLFTEWHEDLNSASASAPKISASVYLINGKFRGCISHKQFRREHDNIDEFISDIKKPSQIVKAGAA